MNPKYNFIYKLGLALDETDRSIKASDLAKILNMASFKTSYNTEHVEEPNEGIHRIISLTYYAVKGEYGQEEAAKVATSFTDEQGNTPWW